MPNKTSIFIFEDNKDWANSLSEILSEQGCNVNCCMYDENKALEMIKSINPNVVISSAKGHLNFLKTLRQLFSQTIILVITGGDIDRRDYKLIVNRILIKPVDISTVISTIQELLLIKQSALSV